MHAVFSGSGDKLWAFHKSVSYKLELWNGVALQYTVMAFLGLCTFLYFTQAELCREKRQA